MLLTEGNPEAIHFNVNKKLAQLNKVIALFQSEEEERAFKKQFLHKKYDPKFLEIMNKYSIKMAAVEQKMRVIDEDTNAKYSNIYRSKYESQKKELKEIVTQIYNRHNSQIDKHDKMVSTFLNTLHKIDYDINKKYNPKIFEEKSIQTIKYLEQFRLDSNQKLKNDINDVYVNSSIQLKEHQDSFTNKIVELKDQHKQKIEKIHTLYLEKSQQNEQNKKDTLNQKLNTIQKIKKRCLIKGKNTVLQSSKEFKSMISTEKENIFSLIKELNDGYTEFQKQIATHKQYIKKEIKEISNSSKTLNQDFNEKKDSLKKSEEELMNKLAKVKDKNRKEMDEKNQQFELNKQNMKNTFENTKNNLKKEYESIKGKMNEIANSKSSEFREKENAYNDLIKLNASKLNQLKTSLNQGRISHSTEIEDKKNKNSREITESRQIHFNKLKEKQNEIIQLKEKTEKQRKIYNEDIDNLRNQHEADISMFCKQRQEQIDEFKQTIKNSSKSNDEELEKIKNDEEIKLKEIQKLNEEQIEKHKLLLIDKKQKFIEDIQNQNKQNLMNVEQSQRNQNQKIIDDFNKSYQEKEIKLNNELDSISTVSNSEDQMKFQKLTEKYELLKEDKSDLIQKNSESKDNLINSFKKSTEDENKRHLSFLANLSKSNNGRNTRQKVLNSLKKQIEQTIETRQTQGIKLNEENDKLKDKFEIIQSSSISQKTEIINDSKAIEENLLREIEELKRNKIVLINNKKKEKEAEISAKKKEIDNLGLYYLNEKDDIYHKNSDALIRFDEEYKKLKEIYERKLNDYYSKFSDESKNISSNRSLLSHDYFERQKLLRFKIRDIKDNIKREKVILDDKAKRDLSQNLDKAVQYEKSLRFNLQKIKEDNEGLNGFLDEKIEVLRSRLNEIKRRYNDRKPREEEGKQIELLSLRLSKITNALNYASSDLKRCRSLSFDRENKMNSLLEKSNVRIIPTTPR